MTCSVQTKELTVKFGDRAALKDVGLELPVRGLSVIAGRSGSGKSTFLRALNRLNDELGGQTSGEVNIDLGQGLEPVYPRPRRPLSEIRRLAGMVFQSPNVLPGSILKNMCLPLEIIGSLTRAEIAGRAEEALKAVGLWPEVETRLNLSARALSGGQQQRLCLARALALEPRVLLMDEPTASLDVMAAGRVEDCLKELAESYPVVVVSHSLAQAWRLTERLYFFHDGRFVKTLSPDQAPTENELLSFIMALEKSGEAR